MNKQKTVLETFGGVKGVVLGVIVFAAVIAFQAWNRGGSQSALQDLGAELGLNYEQSGTRPKLRGRIDEIGVAIEVTSEGVANQSATRVVTRLRLYPEGGPYGRIVGASLRQQIIEEFSDEEEPIATGDAAFDDEVFVFGDRATLLAHLGHGARRAVRAATDAGWRLDGYTWEVREPGRITDPADLRLLLDLGLEAARSTRIEEGAVPMAMPVAAGGDQPSPEAPPATAPTSVDEALAALAEMGTDDAIEAAIYLAASGDGRDEVRNELMMAIIKPEWQARVIEVMEVIGGPLELTLLKTVKGENEAAAKAAIEAIEARRQ